MGSDNLDATFAALADPTRRAILARLASGEASVTEIAQPFEMSLPAVSKHLKVLERAGLIGRSREAQWRRCRLDASPLRDVSDWLDRYREFWEQRFDRLAAYLAELQDEPIGVTASDGAQASEVPPLRTGPAPARTHKGPGDQDRRAAAPKSRRGVAHASGKGRPRGRAR